MAVGFYRERVLPHLVDRACRTSELASWRREVTDGLAGRVLEIGFGSGLNLEHYPAGVERPLRSAVVDALADALKAGVGY